MLHTLHPRVQYHRMRCLEQAPTEGKIGEQKIQYSINIKNRRFYHGKNEKCTSCKRFIK